MPDEIIISPTGEIRAIYSPNTDKILRSVAAKSGTVTETRRASHVEPTAELSAMAVMWLSLHNLEIREKLLPVNLGPAGDIAAPAGERVTETVARLVRPYLPQDKWWGDMLPVDGPVLGPYDNREIALAEEAKWLRAHHIPVCDSCRNAPAAHQPTEADYQALESQIQKDRAAAGMAPMTENCAHSPTEDCLICTECGECSESLDDNDVCSNCREKASAQPSA